MTAAACRAVCGGRRERRRPAGLPPPLGVQHDVQRRVHALRGEQVQPLGKRSRVRFVPGHHGLHCRDADGPGQLLVRDELRVERHERNVYPQLVRAWRELERDGPRTVQELQRLRRGHRAVAGVHGHEQHGLRRLPRGLLLARGRRAVHAVPRDGRVRHRLCRERLRLPLQRRLRLVRGAARLRRMCGRQHLLEHDHHGAVQRLRLERLRRGQVPRRRLLADFEHELQQLRRGHLVRRRRAQLHDLQHLSARHVARYGVLRDRKHRLHELRCQQVQPDYERGLVHDVPGHHGLHHGHGGGPEQLLVRRELRLERDQRHVHDPLLRPGVHVQRQRPGAVHDVRLLRRGHVHLRRVQRNDEHRVHNMRCGLLLHGHEQRRLHTVSTLDHDGLRHRHAHGTVLVHVRFGILLGRAEPYMPANRQLRCELHVVRDGAVALRAVRDVLGRLYLPGVRLLADGQHSVLGLRLE